MEMETKPDVSYPEVEVLEGSSSSASDGRASPAVLAPRSRGRAVPIKLGDGADQRLIARVREQRVLYDPAHEGYMDIRLKNHLWKKIGRELKANPSACKSRWYNIRDNYRKSLRKSCVTGVNTYKFGTLLTFLEPYYKGNVEASPLRPRTKPRPKPKLKETEDSDDDERLDTKQQIQEVSSIKADIIEEEQGSVVELDYPVISNVNSNQAQAVDAFLAALAPPLKGLSPYHLSLAKAEIYATVHKYELKGIVEGSWQPNNVNPLE